MSSGLKSITAFDRDEAQQKLEDQQAELQKNKKELQALLTKVEKIFQRASIKISEIKEKKNFGDMVRNVYSISLLAFEGKLGLKPSYIKKMKTSCIGEVDSLLIVKGLQNFNQK